MTVTGRLIWRVLAGLLVVPVAGCTSGHHAGATKAAVPPRSSASATPSAVIALAPQRPTAVWQLHAGTFTTGERTHRALDVGKTLFGTRHDRFMQAALVFSRPLVTPSCIVTATLVLHVTGGRPLEGAELAVYPSDESNYLSSAKVANSQLDLGRLIDNRPRGYAFTVTRGDLQIDVTDLYRTWAAGGPFPSMGATVDPNDPMALIVRPPDAAIGAYDVLISNDRRTPQLRVTERASCSQAG